MESRTSSSRLSLRTRGLLALAAIVALLTMNGLAPNHSSASAAGEDAGVTHSALHHLLVADEHPGAATSDHHGDCADDSCSSSQGMAQLIEACIVALATALTFGLLRRRRVVSTSARFPSARTDRVRPPRVAWPPPPLLSELGISRT